MSAVADIGCIVCLEKDGIYSPAEIHHIDGKTKADAHKKILPLCVPHHRVASPDGEWVTRHGPGRRAGKYVFELECGSEEELLELVLMRIGR